jgi:RecQ family ATP-dependent DNA helicase
MVHGLVEEAREVLFTKLMKVDMDAERQVDPQQVPAIHWDSMVDNPSESRVGWSFLDDERNKFEVDGQWWLYERVYKEQRLREQFIDPSRESTKQVQEEEVEAYQRQVERFQELLLILMHICGGQSARAPELLGIRWTNTEQGGVRNIFVEDGLVAFVTTYHKGYRSSGNIKIVHRYLPREIGELLVYYLWLVRPFHERLQFQMNGKPCQSAFVWGGSKKTEHRRWTGPKRDRKGVDEAEAIEWTSERMRHVMQQASMRWIGVKLHISSWRHISIAMSRRYCREHAFPEASQEDDQDEDDLDQDNPWDLQSGHSTHIAGMIYARELMEGGSAVISRREQFRRISTTWHRFLQFGSAQAGWGMGCKRKRGPDDDDMQEVRRARWKRLRDVKIHQELQEMLGEHAEFRGLQKPALEAIMRNESPILVIMGTGAGKSLLFQLPAHSQKSGTTVVIVPLKSLEQSLHERCQKAGISCIRWDAQRSNRMAQIVLVQPESAVGTKFAQYLNRLEGLGQLDRVVIDECHTVLNSRPDFRPKMKEAGAIMVKRGVQMVYLTATLRPSEEQEFMRIMKVQIPPKQLFRGCTSRPNIAYSVVECEAEAEMTAIQELVEQKLEQYPTPAKIIIYGSSIDTIEEVGAQLGCHIYHAGIGSPKTKSRIQERWERADGRVVVASNAFGLGIDKPDVRVVIHVGPIHQMPDYGQESGRAGRDGQPSEAIIMVGAGRQEALQKHHERLRRQPAVHRAVITDADKRQVEQEKVDRFISGAQCRRIDLDQELDGRTDRRRCEEGEERCDVCQKSDSMMEEAEALREAYMAEQERQEALDSGIDMASQAFEQASSPSFEQTSSPLFEQASRPSFDQASSAVMQGAQSAAPPSSPGVPLEARASSAVVQGAQLAAPPSSSGMQPEPQASSPPIVRPDTFPPVRPDTFPSSPPAAIPSTDLPRLRWFSNDRSKSPSHIFSSDQEFDSRMIAIAEEVEFQSQQARYRRDQAYAQLQAQEDSRAVWELERQLEEWVGRCPVCFIRGFPESKHSIISCVEDGAKEVKDNWFRMRKRMRDDRMFAAFSCCYDCHVPQSICAKWVAAENGKWGRLAQGKCQFEGIVMPLVISAIGEGTDQIYNMIMDQIEGSGVSIRDEEETYKWFGQKEEWGGIEVTRLVQMFYRIVKSL